jgi:hypothetical protein
MNDSCDAVQGYGPHSQLGALVTDPQMPDPWWPAQPTPEAILLHRVREGLRRL